MNDMDDLIAQFARVTGEARARPSRIDDRLSDLDAFGSNPGALRARIYLPEGLPSDAPLVVVLHGCTQSAAAYDYGAGWSTLADRHGFALLFPEQQRANNPSCCFNWFVPDDTRRDRGEAKSIHQMIERMIAEHGIDRGRIFITGLSAGGAMASVMLAAYPETFAGGGIIAGLPYGSATSVPEAFERMRGQGGPSGSALAAAVRGASSHAGPWPTISIWHGSGDATVNPSNAGAILEQWRGLHGVDAAPDRVETVDGHRRRLWCDASGRAVIEDFTITGMGHGTPLATSGEDACGAAGPFMLEARISSTRHIARFWGLLEPHAPSAAEDYAAPAASHTLPTLAATRLERIPLHRTKPRQAAPSGVQSVIENALRAAGLMK